MKHGVEFEKDAGAFLAPLIAKAGPLLAKAGPALAKVLPWLKGVAGKGVAAAKGLPGKIMGGVKGMTWKKGLGTAGNTALYGSMLIPSGGKKAQPVMRQVPQQASRMPAHHVRTY
jgi:hypothetical protein